MMETPEAKIKAEICKILDKYGVLYSMPIGSPYGASNMCDFICCVPTKFGTGQYMEIEAKATPSSKVSPRQADKLKLVRKANGVAVVVNNKTLDEFESLVERTVVGLNTVSRYRDDRTFRAKFEYGGCPYPTVVRMLKSATYSSMRFVREEPRIDITLTTDASIGTVAHEAMHAAYEQFPDTLVDTITYEQVAPVLTSSSYYKKCDKARLLEEVRCAYVAMLTNDVARIYTIMNKGMH